MNYGHSLTQFLARAPLHLSVGQELHGYQLIEKTSVPELNLDAYHLVHNATGANHLHIDTSDTNNVFMVTFKTTPTDSTGVAHILEHTALCGSEKYPIRDPFFNMTRRSLKTFMNAWTAPDYTSYPFSTENEKDYYNLLSVYLDAAYFPRLDRMDFLQEGHRLEFTNPDDKTSPLEIKGIVFNEMKGAMADPGSLFSHHLQHKLFPTVTYTHNSGGDPADIPQLTWEQLVEFHKTHYHPSNSWTITYGDLPLEPRLKFIQENALKRFKKIQPETGVPDEQRFTHPQRYEVTGPLSPMADGKSDCRASTAFLLTPNYSDPVTTSALAMLSTLLMEGQTSPFYQSLIESQLGNSYAPSSGYESSLRETAFAIGLQGLKEEDCEKVEKIVMETLEAVAKDGFPQERIDAILHRTEINLRQRSSNFGLNLSSSLVPSWIHGGNPCSSLDVTATLDKLKEKIQEGPFFQDLVKQYFLNNKHSITLKMTPDENYPATQLEKEKQYVKELSLKLSESERDKIFYDAKLLKEWQGKKQDPNVLPTVTIQDIEKTKPVDILDFETISGASVQWCPQPTNDLIYFRALLNVNNIPEQHREELMPLVPLFCQVLTSLGTEKMNRREFSQNMELYTGNMGSEAMVFMNHSNFDQFHNHIHLNSFCLSRNISKMFELWTELFCSVNWNDPDHIKTEINGMESDMQDSLISEGHLFARRFASGKLTTQGQLEQSWEGLSQFRLLSALSNEDNPPQVIEKLKRIGGFLLQKNSLRICINAEALNMPETRTHLTTFLNSIPSLDSNVISAYSQNVKILNPNLPSVNSFIGLPADCNFNVMCFLTVPYTHPDFPVLQVLAHLMTNAFLHGEIREKGGAYGGGASQNQNGTFTFYSYRDPVVLPTIEQYGNAIQFIQDSKFTDENITEAKLNVFSDIDHPVSPGNKGRGVFVYGITHDMRMKNRERLFNCTRDDLVRVCSQYLSSKPSSVATFGSDQNKSEFQDRSGWEYLE